MQIIEYAIEWTNEICNDILAFSVCAFVFCYLLTSIVQLIAAIWMSARIAFIVISVCAVFPFVSDTIGVSFPSWSAMLRAAYIPIKGNSQRTQKKNDVRKKPHSVAEGK